MQRNRFRTIRLEVFFEEYNNGFSFNTTKGVSIFSKYDTPAKIVEFAKIAKKYVRKQPNRLMVTIEGVDDGFQTHAIKRYSFDVYAGENTIEHRPYLHDYSVQSTETFDTLTKMVNAFNKDFISVIEANIAEFECEQK